MNADNPSRNPLVEAFAPFVRLPKMPAKLFHDPLEHVPWRDMPPEAREPYLELLKEHFFPTGTAVDIAVRMHAAILGGLSRRNPLEPAEQRRINQLALLGKEDTREALPALSNPATGGIIAAITGMGKSCLVDRTLRAIAPQQVIVHARSEACGWSRLMQVAYLKLDFPSNGTRGGLVERILYALDNLLGTGYSARPFRMRNLDASLVFVMKVLSMHRVGILVLDELQPSNFAYSPWHEEFVLFLLSLLNLGIPTMICGQPGAFIGIKHERQTLRRFSEIGNFALEPASPSNQAWWKTQMVPGIMRFNLCEDVDRPEEIIRMSRDAAAGVPGFFACVWKEAQRRALRRGGHSATLTPEDFVEASKCQAILELMREAARMDAEGTGDYAAMSRAATPKQMPRVRRNPVKGRSDGPAARKRVVHKLRAADERRQKQMIQRTERAAELARSLTPRDLRTGSRSIDMLDGLDGLQRDEANPGAV